MTRRWRWVFLLALAGVVCPSRAPGQIDPVKRELFQFGYNAALEGHPPLAAYAFYYWNQPDFLGTNLALRLAVSPTYLDSELGIRHEHSFYVSLTAGTSVNADRFSAYRLGSVLPLVSEFPLSLPGYFYQEISARDFVLAGGNYMIPLDKSQRWSSSATASTAVVDYLARHGTARQLA